jgi:hypothetical protein
MKSISTKREIVFNPWLVLAVSLGGAAVFALYALRSTTTRSHALELSGSFLYVVPIVVPFVAFLFDRAARFRKLNKLHFIVDALVVLMAMGRVVGNVPFVSGHTLFLTYATISSRSSVVRVTALLVMAQTVYLSILSGTILLLRLQGSQVDKQLFRKPI